MTEKARSKAALMGLAGALLLLGAAQAAAPAPASAMIAQEGAGDCGSWGDCGGSGGGGGSWGDGSDIGDGGWGGDDGGSWGDDGGSSEPGDGGFASGGDDAGSIDGSWGDDSGTGSGDGDVKDPANLPPIIIQDKDGNTWELIPVGEPEMLPDDGDDPSIWDPETDRPSGPIVAMRHRGQGRQEVAKMKRKGRKAKAKAGARHRR